MNPCREGLLKIERFRKCDKVLSFYFPAFSSLAFLKKTTAMPIHPMTRRSPPRGVMNQMLRASINPVLMAKIDPEKRSIPEKKIKLRTFTVLFFSPGTIFRKRITRECIIMYLTPVS